MKRLLLVLTMVLCVSSAQAANWYVDNAATGSNNGTSWNNAWTSIAEIKGLNAGDTVYISGGRSGKTYTPGTWTPIGGTEGNEITYKTGQDIGHTGMVTFSGSGVFLGTGINLHNFSLTGNVSGTRKMQVIGYGTVVNGDLAVGVTLAYMTLNGKIRMYDSRKIELDHLYWNPVAGINHAVTGIGRGDTTGWGNNKIHHCTFNLYYQHGVNGLGGNGDDGIVNVGAIDIYNNNFIGTHVGMVVGGQHGDGIQTDGRYIRIYNNYFENIPNYMLFGEFWGNSQDWVIYNNVFNFSDAVLTGQPSAAIAMGCSGGSSGGQLSNMIISNNTVIGGGRGISLGFGKAGCSNSDNFIVNNILYNSHLEYKSPGVTASNNTNGGTSGINFASATDFHLRPDSTLAINQGISPSYLTSVYTTDRAGVSRMLKPAWDIGAYAFGALDEVLPTPPKNLFVK